MGMSYVSSDRELTLTLCNLYEKVCVDVHVLTIDSSVLAESIMFPCLECLMKWGMDVMV